MSLELTSTSSNSCRTLNLISEEPLVLQEGHLFIQPYLTQLDEGDYRWKMKIRRSDGLTLLPEDERQAKEAFDFFSMPVAGNA